MSQLAVIGGAKGGGGTAPRLPVVQPDSIRSVSIVDVVEAICEGEIEGFATEDPLQSIYLDDTPLKTGSTNNFKGVTLDYRLGTQDQTYIPGSVNNATAALVSVGAEVTHDVPVIRSISDTTTDAARVTIRFASLYKVDATTGDRLGVSVTVQISVRLDGGSWVPADLRGRQVIHGKTESPYERSYRINLKDFGEATTYDIRVSRVSDDPVDNEFSDFSWSTYAKLSYAKLRYPNTVVCRLTFDARHFDNVPARGYLLKGMKVKVPGPSVYSPEARAYTASDWDGNFVTAFTRNPAWILYDLVTNPRYGLGELINPIYQDKWSLFSIAKRCDEMVPDGKGGQEQRYSLDVYIQSAESAKSVVKDIASSFDAMAYWGNAAILTTQDSPKAATELYVPGNVINGRFNYIGSARQTRYTVALVQWNDPDDKYRIATEYVEDPHGIDRYGYREMQVAAIGCTSRAQAHRHGKRILLTGRLEPEVVTFGVGLEGMKSSLGNICRVADPLRADGFRLGGRVRSGTVSAVILDQYVTVPPGYKLAVIDSEGVIRESLITSAVTDIDGNFVINVSPPLAAAPESDCAWIIYNPVQSQALWRITGIQENENPDDGFYTITAVKYDPSKYALIDSTVDLPPLPENPFINTGVVPPSGLIITEGVYTALEGVRRYLDISWSASTDKFLRGYRLLYRLDGAMVFDGEVDGQSYRIKNPHVGVWEVTLSAVTTFGKTSTSVTVEYTLGEMYAINSVSVTDLVLVGGGSNFTGRSAMFDWDTNALSVLGFSDAYAAGSGGQSPWFRDYQVDIYSGATLLRSDFVTESAYVYTFDKNLEDGGPRRSFTIRVRARDLYGRYSQLAEKTVSNPAPPAISGVNVYSGVKSIIVQYLPPTDNDWQGAILFLSTASDFTPGPLTQVYIGSDTIITLPDLLENTAYYLRIASYDAFGGPSDYTLSGVIYNKTIPSLPVLTPDEVKDKLQAALDDPANDPLIFEAPMFAMRFEGTDKTPFIVGMVDDNAAILLDADVYVTSTLSADQIVGGRIAATENIIIGNGNAIINGDGSMIVYDGPDTESNRDFAILSGGTLSFQRYRGGAYHDYKSVRRVEYGQANSGEVVTLPGYWDAQPKLIVSPASLRSYHATYPSSSQTWRVRGDNLRESIAGSGIWQFDAIAELNYDSSSGTTTVASYSGALNVDAWYSAESILPTGVVYAVFKVLFSSIKGNGTSTRGYYYRSVSWKVQAWNNTAWVDLETQVRNITLAEHNQQISDTNAMNIPSGVTKVRVYFQAYNTTGAVYSLGGDDYNYMQESAAVNPTTNGYLEIYSGSTWQTKTAHMPAYTKPFGWDIYAVKYVANWGIDNGNGGSTGELWAGGVKVVSRTLAAYGHAGGTYNSGQLAKTSYNPDYWLISLTTTATNGVIRSISVAPQSSTIYLKQMIVNSATPNNKFALQDYAWDITGSIALAQGSLNWMAVGD